MITKELLYQVITFVLTIVILDFVERRRPRFPVNRLHNLGLNITAMLVMMMLKVFKRAYTRLLPNSCKLRLNINF